jgi:hypothetical protein
MILCLDIHQHPWNCSCTRRNVSEGQIGEQEVLGGVHMEVIAENQNDEQVHKHCYQIQRQNKGCSSRSSVSLRRRNSEIAVWCGFHIASEFY